MQRAVRLGVPEPTALPPHDPHAGRFILCSKLRLLFAVLDLPLVQSSLEDFYATNRMWCTNVQFYAATVRRRWENHALHRSYEAVDEIELQRRERDEDGDRATIMEEHRWLFGGEGWRLDEVSLASDMVPSRSS